MQNIQSVYDDALLLIKLESVATSVTFPNGLHVAYLLIILIQQ